MYVAQKSHAEAILSHSLAISQNNSQNIWKCAGGGIFASQTGYL